MSFVRAASTRSVLIAFLFLAMALAPAPAASAPQPALFSEDWEDGLEAWTVTGDGASIDCAIGNPGCSLRLTLPAGADQTAVDRSLAVPMEGVTSLAFSFRPDSRYGYTDALVHLTLDTGTRLSLILSDGGGCCNAFSRLMSTEHGWGPMNQWYDGATWHAVTLYIDPAAARAQGALWDADGLLLGLSDPIPIKAGATAITALRIEAVESYYEDSTSSFRFDSLRLGPDALPGLPTSPKGISIARGYNELHLSWTPPVSTGNGPITGYEIWRGEYADPGSPIATVNASARSFTDTGLGENAHRTYRVRALNENGAGSLSQSVAARTYGPPGAPYKLRAAGALDGNILTWTPGDGNGFPILSYRIYRLNATTGGFEPVGEAAGDASSFLDTTRDPLGVSTYAVTTVTPRAESSRSRTADAYLGKPGHPRNLTLEPHEKSIVLDWDAPEEAAALPVLGYTIYRVGWVDGYDPQYAVYATSETWFEDVNVESIREYEYYVEAVSPTGHSDPSDDVYGWTGGPPSAPVNVHAEQLDRSTVRITWSPPIENAATVYAYEVMRREGDGPWEYARYTDRDQTTVEDYVGATGTYAYRVRAYNGYDGPFSDEVTVEVKHALPPRNLQADARYRDVTLTWDLPAETADYMIYEYCLLRSSALEAEKAIACVSPWDEEGRERRYLDKDVVTGMNYTYRVLVDTWWEKSAPSSPVSVTVGEEELLETVDRVIERQKEIWGLD